MKSSVPASSAFDRRGAISAAARGNAGANFDIGPTSGTKRLTIPRQGDPLYTLVIAVSPAQ